VDQDRYQLSGSCEYDNELPGFIKGRQIITDIPYNSTYPDAGCPDRLGPSGKHFLIVFVLHLFVA
jgi:hypothetical protein